MPTYYFPIALSGTAAKVTPSNLAAYYRHTEQTHAGGYFPLGTNTVWHGGVHLHAKRGTLVQACADGRVVAARLAGDIDKAYGEYGSVNFVLILHSSGGGAVDSSYRNTLEVGHELQRELEKKYTGYRTSIEGYWPSGDKALSNSVEDKDLYVCTSCAAEVLGRAKYPGYRKNHSVANIHSYPKRYSGSLTADAPATGTVTLKATLPTGATVYKWKKKEVNAQVKMTSGAAVGRKQTIKKLTVDASGAAAIELSGAFKKGKTIKTPKKDDSFEIYDLKWSIEQEHEEIKGVVCALKKDGLGKVIDKADDLQPGDFVQYWRYNGMGHVVQVEENKGDGKLVTHGSHGTKHGVTGGYDVDLNLGGKSGTWDTWKWFAIRPVGNGSPPYYSLYMHLNNEELNATNKRLKSIEWIQTDPGTATELTTPDKVTMKWKDRVIGSFDAGVKLERLAGKDTADSYGVRFVGNAAGVHFEAKADKDRPTGKVSAWVNKSDFPAGPDEQLLKHLAAGQVVALDRPVRAGGNIWTSGEYGVKSWRRDSRAGVIHWEVFSEENLRKESTQGSGPDGKTYNKGWKEASDPKGKTEDFNMDCQEILEMVEQDSFGSDDLLTFQEIRRFYRSNAHAQELRKYACQFVSEWGIDLDKAISELKGRWFTRHLKDRIEPYLWWDQAKGAGVPLPESKMVWHYNPIAFLETHIDDSVAPAT